VSERWVYGFGDGGADGDASMKNLLGGKGANLAEMSSLGLPVPPGFTVSTEACTHYYANGRSWPAGLEEQVRGGLARVEAATGKRFGDPANPLLVSVRSGARASMPGMMDTVLNLGLNDQTVEGLARLSGDRRFAFDSYRRFIQMYSNVVLDLDHHLFEEVLDEAKAELDAQVDTTSRPRTGSAWSATTRPWCAASSAATSPRTPRSSCGARRRRLRQLDERSRQVLPPHARHPESWGTAVNVQSMVFGNMGETLATGVAFTRNPSTGEARSTASS
jgi:pyruvate,orthophosphate dikinase